MYSVVIINLSYLFNKMVLYITYILVLLIINDSCGNTSLNFETYEDNYQNISKLLYIGNETQYLIAATKNYLLKFSPYNLTKPLEVRRTGPVNDSTLCTKPNSCIVPACGKVNRKDKCTDVYVKSWTTNHSHLVVCYNAFLGYCETIYMEKKFDFKAQGSLNSVVSNDLKAHSTILYYQDKVYVAIETTLEVKRQEIDYNTLSIRRLPNFNIIEVDGYMSTAGVLGSGRDLIFPLEFKGSFHIKDERKDTTSRDNIFFLLNQPENKQNPTHGKLQVRLAKICSMDSSFSSFIDIGLNCGKPHVETYYKIDSWHLAHVGKNLSNWFRKNTRFKDIIDEEKANFDQILFINFEVIRITDNYLETLPMFVTCAFPIAEIMEILDIVKKKCEVGDGSVNYRPYNSKSSEMSCRAAPFKSGEKGYCGGATTQNNRIIGDHYGEYSGQGHQIIHREGFRGSSLYVFSIFENYTVALIGGSNGHMYKYDLYNDQSKELADQKLFDSEILDIKLRGDKTVAFAISNSKIATVNFAICNMVTSCDSCLKLGPFCGWCIASGTCSTLSNCIGGAHVWIPYKRDLNIKMCPEIKGISPHSFREFSCDNSPEVKFQVIKVPQSFLTANDNNLICKYYSNSSVLITSVHARLMNSTIICSGILYNNLISHPFSDNFVSVNLKIFIGKAFLVQTPYYIYDCSLSNTCTKCTDNRFPCMWCILGNNCVTAQSQSCLRNYSLQSNMSHQCPKFEFLTKQVAFPSGQPIEIDLKVQNINIYQNMQIEFFCIEYCGNNTVKAISDKDVLTCKFSNINISLLFGEKNCSVSVIWRLMNTINGFLEHANTFSFQIYNCQILSKYCDDCVFLPQKYRCGFCIKTSKCVMESECKFSDEKWINRQDQYCPSPFINEIIPENSTLLSESVILIKGRNFGFKKDDIELSISLENNALVIKCTFIDWLFISAKQFRCQIAKVSSTINVPVSFDFVYRSTKSSYLAKKEFSFYAPEVSYIIPTIGPLAGGTIIEVFGRYLNVGSNKTVLFNYLNSITECTIIENNGTILSCRLKNFVKSRRRKRNSEENSFKAFISMTFDAKDFIYRNVSYSFYPNPIVTKISRDKFLPNGAQWLEVTGSHINTINKPYLSFTCRNRQSDFKKCLHLKEQLICPVPEIENISVTTNCELLLSMEKTVNIHKAAVAVYPLPKFANVSTIKKLPSTSWSFFEKKASGDNTVQFKFDAKDQIYFAAFDLKELIVSIGELKCRHIVVSIKSVECQLLLKEIDIYKNYIVVMNISQSFQIKLGYIQFSKGGINLDTTSLVIIVVIIIIPFVLLIVLAVFIVRWSQKQNKKKHQRQTIFSEKTEREANEILKHGFTELNDIAIQNDVNKNYLPVYPHRVYILYNLFPNTHPRLCKGSNNYTDSILNIDNYYYDINDPTTHPLLFDKQIQVLEFTVEYSRKLSKLFEDELFVLILFSFLEDDGDVGESKKADIVSLLSLILTQDMSNYSQILKILIKDDYDKKKEMGDEKSMFRQSDLLSKLLSNWFIILMYDHFQNYNPGGDLLTLYFIIQSVINNGPVDFVTKKSQYALNMNSLLERKFNSQKMKIKVVISDGMKLRDEVPQPIYEVVILSCDTIQQVKLKIFEEKYKYYPYSEWCNIDDFVLAKVDKNDECEDENANLLKPQTLKDKNKETNKYMTAEDHGIQDGDTLYLKEKFAQSEAVSESHSFRDSKSNSVKTINSVNPNVQSLNLKFTKDPQNKSFRHLGQDSLPDLTKKSETTCCTKKMTEQRYDYKENSSCCLIYAQVLKKRLEPHIRLLFDDILDQDQVPLCVKDLFSYFNTFCSDEKVLLSFKSNSLMLRFWIHFVTNIDFLFDVPLANNVPVLECLKCIGRILMDVCSESQNHDVWLTQLFADIIKDYSPKVLCYYESVKKAEENNNEYYGSCRIEGINISLAIVILYRNYIKPIHEKFIEAIKKSNKPIDKQNKWITILKEVNNLYTPEVLFANGNVEVRTTSC